MEKQIIIVVQAAPKTQPGGVHGALAKLRYQLDTGPLFMSALPRYRPPKLMIMNITSNCTSLRSISFDLGFRSDRVYAVLQQISYHS